MYFKKKLIKYLLIFFRPRLLENPLMQTATSSLNSEIILENNNEVDVTTDHSIVTEIANGKQKSVKDSTFSETLKKDNFLENDVLKFQKSDNKELEENRYIIFRKCLTVIKFFSNILRRCFFEKKFNNRLLYFFKLLKFTGAVPLLFFTKMFLKKIF